MARNSIGQFIAALRRANGMTQQDVADRLNVSNKAVSRWERDECAPDISLIPAIAEMFGVSCDELLRGERFSGISAEEISEKREQKTLKQVKILINRTLSGVKTMTYVALAVTFVGLICMFGISYAFYRPIIGFFVMLLFDACATALTAVAVSRAKDLRRYNELFELADADDTSHFDRTLGSLSFRSYFAVFASVVASLPLIILSTDYIESVLTVGSYFKLFCGAIAFLLIFVWLKCREPYINYVANGAVGITENPTPTRKMTLVQLALMFFAGFLFVIAPYFLKHISEESYETMYIAINVMGLVLMAASIAVFAAFTARHQADRKAYIFKGARNVLMLPAALIVSEMHSVGWSYEPYTDTKPTTWVKYDDWYTEYLLYAITYAAVVYIVFAVIEVLVKCKKNKG